MSLFRLWLLLAILFLWVLPASSQSVDCGNGNSCPSGNACLKGGLCGRLIESAPGSTRLSTGTYCDPGWHEHRYKPGVCVPPDYVECENGSMCPPPNAQCSPGGKTCEGGPPTTGPMCGNVQCAEGRICSSAGLCMNTAILQDCGNGQICSRYAACGAPRGCMLVAPERTRQQSGRQ